MNGTDRSRWRRPLLIGVGVIVVVLGIAIGVALRGTYPLPENPPITATAGTDSIHVDGIRRAFGDRLTAHPGLSIAAIRRDTLLLAVGIGFADLETAEAARAETQFRIYSATKPLTAVAAARLAETGRLELDRPVGDYVVAVEGALAGATARQLIGHLGGVRHYADGEWLSVSDETCETVGEALGAFVDDELVAPPGREYRYSSYGYVLLSAVLEAAVGLHFPRWMREAVLEPAGMENTAIEMLDPTPDLATPYEDARLGRVRVARPVDNTCKWGGGAYVSTAPDLARFAAALSQGLLLDSATNRVVFTPMVTATGDTIDYGFGWGLGTDDAGRRYAAHSGGAIGGRSALVVYLDASLSVAVLANSEGEQLLGRAHELARSLLEETMD
jgi:CubicO group peptidase (beta-lactamase class C family)